jgi:hypothetical protein
MLQDGLVQVEGIALPPLVEEAGEYLRKNTARNSQLK